VTPPRALRRRLRHLRRRLRHGGRLRRARARSGGSWRTRTLILEGAQPFDPDGREDVGAGRHVLAELDVETAELEDRGEELVGISVVHAVEHVIPLVFRLVGHPALEISVAIVHQDRKGASPKSKGSIEKRVMLFLVVQYASSPCRQKKFTMRKTLIKRLNVSMFKFEKICLNCAEPTSQQGDSANQNFS
jgi:hypothetical protein